LCIKYNVLKKIPSDLLTLFATTESLGSFFTLSIKLLSSVGLSSPSPSIKIRKSNFSFWMLYLIPKALHLAWPLFCFIFKIFNDLNADDETTKNQFISKLLEKCESNPPTFDLTLLGLGDDGHTASLFPYQENKNVDDFVIFNEGKGLKRISLTPKVLSASSKIVFLVSGASKRIALERLLDEKEPPDRTPSKLIKSINQISIFCDQESAKELEI